MADAAARQLLDLALPPNDSGARTVRGYLTALLETLWTEEEGFSGKRPFGNSGWQYDLYAPMARAGLVTATFDGDGFLDTFDDAAADTMILAAIRELGNGHG